MPKEDKKLVVGQPQPNKINFVAAGESILTLGPNGDIFVKGKLVKNDLEVVDAMREFLVKSGMLQGKTEENK